MYSVTWLWICVGLLALGMVWAFSSLFWALMEEKAARVNFEESGDTLNNTIRLLRQLVDAQAAKLAMVEKADENLVSRFADALKQIDTLQAQVNRFLQQIRVTNESAAANAGVLSQKFDELKLEVSGVTADLQNQITALNDNTVTPAQLSAAQDRISGVLHDHADQIAANVRNIEDNIKNQRRPQQSIDGVISMVNSHERRLTDLEKAKAAPVVSTTETALPTSVTVKKSKAKTKK